MKLNQAAVQIVPYRLRVRQIVTYEQSQEHGYSLHAAIPIVWFDKDSDRVASEEMRERKTDGPADHVRKHAVHDDPKLANIEYVLVHYKDGRLDKTQSYDGDHVQGELGLKALTKHKYLRSLGNLPAQKISVLDHP
jgi:hypothetical protein